VGTEEIKSALKRCSGDRVARLLAALGFDAVGLRVPASALADFGLTSEDGITLEVAARYRGFHVLRIIFAGTLDPESVQRTAVALHRHNPTRRALLVFEAEEDRRLVLASWGMSAGRLRLRRLWVDPDAPSPAVLDIVARLAVDGAGTASDLALLHARALDRELVTQRFFIELRRQRTQLATALKRVPADASADRLELALIILTRLLFLYFVQRKRWLNGDPDYLRHLYRAAMRDGIPFYRKRLKPLFFGALNRPAARRSGLARELGVLPYLNGGLFERQPLERAHGRLDVPDEAFGPVFYELLERYQFTLREAPEVDVDVAIDPEMLGRAFEGLMAAPTRSATGTFFTPREVVEEIVDSALTGHLAAACGCEMAIVRELLGGHPAALDPATRTALLERVRSLRVLDPAAGSGAFLLTALQRIEALLDALEGRPDDSLRRFQRREQIVRRNLHGVDVNGTAVHLCELRLWLALAVELEVTDVAAVPPLPNLDINIRQGDALLDPIDFLFDLAGADQIDLTARWNRQLRQLSQRRDRYFHAAGSAKSRLARGLRRAERDLALGFLSELLERIESRRADLRAAAASRDLFGKRAGLRAGQRKAAASLKRRKREVQTLARKIGEADELPFFSFPIHFATPGDRGHRFDIVISNPPWVRTHLWSGVSRRRLKQRFRSLRHAGWTTGSGLAGAGRGFAAQVDLSTLFLERALDLLGEGGVVGFLVPAKLARGLSAAPLRRRLLERTRLLRLEDMAAARARIFDATTYPLVLLARNERPADSAGPNTEIRFHDRHGGFIGFELPQWELPLLSDDLASPWALAPPGVRVAMTRMREAGPPLGARPATRPRRGLFTGANALFVAEEPLITAASQLATVRLGGSEVTIESSSLRPALRGEDLRAWGYRVGAALLWTHTDDGRVLAQPPPLTSAHLRRHRRALKARVDLKPGQPYWSLFRVDPRKWSLRVAWRDIAAQPSAAVIPAKVEFLENHVPLISLNTVYQIPAASPADAHLLAAVLNSTIARAFLKAIAERAAGGCFRFLGWTVGLLPFPERLDATVRESCIEISERAHVTGGLSSEAQRRLDLEVARLYGMGVADLTALYEFDARLSNPGVER